MFGDEGDDELSGGDGNDAMRANEGNDRFFGNEGDDFIDAADGESPGSRDTVDCGPGDDSAIANRNDGSRTARTSTGCPTRNARTTNLRDTSIFEHPTPCAGASLYRRNENGPRLSRRGPPFALCR